MNHFCHIKSQCLAWITVNGTHLSTDSLQKSLSHQSTVRLSRIEIYRPLRSCTWEATLQAGSFPDSIQLPCYKLSMQRARETVTAACISTSIINIDHTISVLKYSCVPTHISSLTAINNKIYYVIRAHIIKHNYYFK